ncbi:MAG: hypothetical protein A2Z25_00480 [Planctomycetes bacterium RBG_16_55_9]|nr:MAG: hypothetical protein A2Z25_00480 [Planctomycetes bacterium RBG_16_55_9]
MCVPVAALAALLAGSLSLAFGLCTTAPCKIEPTGSNVGAVQFDSVIELNRYSPHSLRHDYTIVFARYWVAPDHYSMAVVWAEPQSSDLCFALHPPILCIASDKSVTKNLQRRTVDTIELSVFYF